MAQGHCCCYNNERGVEVSQVHYIWLLVCFVLVGVYVRWCFPSRVAPVQDDVSQISMMIRV